MAQNYDRAIGVRTGDFFSFFYEQQINEESVYRFSYSLGFGSGQKVSVSRIFHRFNLDKLSDDLSFHFGYGAHLGYERWNQLFQDEHGTYRDWMYRPILGLDGIVGLSYNFRSVPLSITLDANPCFDLWGRNYMHIQMLNVGVGLIYYF